mmetsp:Transcript_7197/g.17955  ORF Transcript_7197/g.17955 Transcript_7197/m.17955 type:complete len:352 (-) Transcript_7197:430-1485(-)
MSNFLTSLCRGVTVRGKSPAPKEKSRVAPQGAAPHPIRRGRDDAVCPITGLSAADTTTIAEGPHRSNGADLTSAQALKAMERDPDIVEERLALFRPRIADKSEVGDAVAAVELLPTALPLSVIQGKHSSTSQTKLLARSVGFKALLQFTSQFYLRCFADPHVDKFIADQHEPHAERFALWILEKFGDGTPWSEERRTRPTREMHLGRQVVAVAFDRSSAHFAAWHSPKREPQKWGEHFKVDDARVWMRLHFWAARETGMFKQHPKFMDYYTRFIGHFISIYSSKAPSFTRESARWSADPENVRAYLAAGNTMRDVIDTPVEQALASLPIEERLYTGSRHSDPAWPYDLQPL